MLSTVLARVIEMSVGLKEWPVPAQLRDKTHRYHMTKTKE